MNEIEFLRRKIFLKGQALKVIRAEREALKDRLSLFQIRENLLGQMGDGFNPVLSKKMDCVDFLLRQ